MKLTLCGSLLVAIVMTPLSAETVRLPVTQDNSIVMVDGEWSVNAGTAGQIRIKGNQHIVAMSFDTSAVKGRTAERATLVCQSTSESIAGVTLSTIAAPWDEARSTALTAGVGDLNGWGYPGARFPAVSGGNAFTLTHHTTGRFADGTYHWELPGEMVDALTTGVAYGLAIHEHDADYGRNPTIFSREQSARQPYLLVELADQPVPAPLPATDLRLEPVDATTARLTLRPPAHGFAYDVSIDGAPLGRHNIPLVDTATDQQTIELRDLPAALTSPAPHAIEVVTLSRTGDRSAPAKLSGQLFQLQPLALPKIQTSARSPTGKAPTPANLAIIPVTDKYDERGRPVGDLPDDYRSRNRLFDGRRLKLTAAAGEVVGFRSCSAATSP
ncbi:MAG: hypothetical protein R3B90_19785 [Planctomycetaceae bacterium]